MVKTVKNMIGPDIPECEVLKTGGLTLDDWEIVLDQHQRVELERGRMQMMQSHLAAAVRTIGWLMTKLHTDILYFRDEDNEELGDAKTLMDHTKVGELVWRFRLVREEEDDVDSDREGIEGGSEDSGEE